MSTTNVFADTTYLVGLCHNRDQHHKDSVSVQAALKRLGYLKSAKEIYLSELILIEAVQEVLRHCGFEAARNAFRNLQNNYTILPYMKDDVSKGFYEICSKYGGNANQKGLGIVDAVTVLLMRKHKIGWVLSADTAFDPVVALRRIWTHNLEELEETV
jgi:predicted nucleic acid-binding protein